MSLEEMVNAIAPELKTRGYKKNKLTWYKSKPQLSIVFGIQKSQYSIDVWYYSFGICLEKLCPQSRSISACQIQYGTENIIRNVPLSADSIVRLIDKWETMYGEMDRLKLCAIENTLPKQTSLAAIRYLTSGNIAL